MQNKEIGETEIVELDLGTRRVQFEQVAGLEALSLQELRAGKSPYWAYLWPSARALAFLVAKIPDLESKRVIELGCGPGAPGIVAACFGAKVLLTDIREEALELSRRNAARQKVSVETSIMDWNHPPKDLGTFDLIFACDVMYEDGMLAGVLRFIREHLSDGGMCWLTDPMRVMPGGVEGAARLRGLESNTVVLTPGNAALGGVTLYELWKRKKKP